MVRMSQEERTLSILQAATHVMARHGYHAARVSEIARRARVAEGTLYLYFPSKEEILISLFRDGIGHYLAELDRELATSSSPEASIGIVIASHLGYLEDHPDFAHVTQLELRQPTSRIREAVNAIIAPYLQRIEHLVEQGQTAECFDPTIDPRVARDMIFGTLDACVTTWVMSRHPYRLRSVTEPVRHLVLGGLASPPIPPGPIRDDAGPDQGIRESGNRGP